MGEVSVPYYEVRPRSKDLPSRGTLFDSTPQAAAFHSTEWILMNFLLFLLPAVTLLPACILSGIIGGHSAQDITYISGYLAVCSSCLLSLVGTTGLIIPSCHNVGCVNLVTKATTVQDIFRHLETHGFVTKGRQEQYYFISGGRQILWTDTVDSLGLGSGSHLFLRLRIPGGAPPHSPPSPSPRPAKKSKIKKTRVTNIVLSDEDEEKTRPRKPRPEAPVRGKGGQTSHSNRKQRSDGPPGPERASTPPATLYEMPTTPVKKDAQEKLSRPKKVPKFSPHTALRVAFALQPHLQPAGPNSDSASGSGSDTDELKPQKKRKPRALNRVQHSKEAGWRRVGSSQTAEIFKTFEQWRNDYGPHGYEAADNLVEVKHLGHPVDRPRDIRARPFFIQWITPDCEAPKQFSRDPRPVFRTEYRCNGNCSDVPPSNSDDQSYDSDGYREHRSHSKRNGKHTTKVTAEEYDSDGEKKYKKRRCPHDVVLHVEVYSNDLSKAVIFQRFTHWEAADEYLGMSQHIRQCIMEYASLANMTAGRIKRRLDRAYEEQNTPMFRRPTASQVDNIVSNIRRAGRLDTDPLKSIGIFAKEHPDKIFGYRPVDMSTNPPSRFATGIKSVHAVQSILLWAFVNGIGLDSCWRHKNENRAPVTFITTIDQNNRMLPGPVYLSANVTAETLETFLREVKDLVESMAKDLLSGDVKVHPSHSHFAPQLMAAAKRVRDNNWNWVPLFVMIDKSGAELNAISAVWPDTLAILRWDRDHDTSTSRPKLSRKCKDKLLHAVRELQRCRVDAHWDTEVGTFKERIESFANANTTSMIMQYFERNWFIPLWRDSWTDIGLPAGRNRDIISTNNWTERAFKTFDQIFLENRANKSAYRLVMIIANEWFSYYENWQLGSQNVDKKAFKIAERGHRLWNAGGANIPMPRNSSGERTWRVANSHTVVDSEN
ncbi:hypothetical protein C8R44DRAFT_736802 [Mycena epipterygia]|nr:hypothetical protein C8R44DRAFT_736802 [Mycena epipterygia]